MSTGSLLTALNAAGGVAPGETLTLGTVVSPTDTSAVYVMIDGAVAYVTAIVPDDIRGRLMTPSGIGARVLGIRVGSRFYVTDIISGGGPVEWHMIVHGSFSSISPVTIGQFTWPVGVVVSDISLSGWSSGGGGGSFVAAIDGNTLTGTGPNFFFNNANVHHAFPMFTARYTLTSGGVHTATLATITVLSDSNDVCDWRLVWTPV